MDEGNASRRRRGAGVVTANACTECRKKRSKCDGQAPCSRCAAVKADCIYEVPVRQSKETMRAEIESLQYHRRQNERVFTAISSGPMASETLNRLKNGEPLETIAEWLEQTAIRAMGSSQNGTTFLSTANSAAFGLTLGMAESVGNYIGFGSSEASDDTPGLLQWNPRQSEANYPQSNSTYTGQNEDAMSWSTETTSPHHTSYGPPTLPRPLVGLWRPSSSPNESSARMARVRGQQQVLGSLHTDGSPSRPLSPGGSWTEVTQDIHLVGHFLALYFCWEYPTFASLSREDFLADFCAGNPRHCSSLLVNAMLALGCRFSKLPESLGDPNDSFTSGDHFFAEAQRLLVEDDRTSLTTIQALGLISLREANCGRDTESFYYAGQAIRLAVEAGLHLEATEPGEVHLLQEEKRVRAATFWGVFALDQAWGLMVGRIPHFSRAANFIAKPSIVDDVESSEWVPYTDEGVPETMSAWQPSNIRSVYKCFCELSELIHQSLYALYTPRRRLTSNELLSVYTRYLNWYSSLPEALRLGRNFTPAVLFSHLLYHFAILLLFRPFIKLRFIGSRVSPLDICSQAADAITTLVRFYDQLYTLQRTPSFIPFIVLAACIVHLVRIPTSQFALVSFRQGAQDLRDMSSSNAFALQALNILRFLTNHWGIRNALEDESQLSPAQILQLCIPSSTSLNFFCPIMVGDRVIQSGQGSLSTLFAPFPMQGLPLIANENEIERDGFSVLP